MAENLYADDPQFRTEVRDGMRIDWDVPIEMDDGNVLRADIFRPNKRGRFPVIMSHGPYAKGLAFQEGYETAWNIMVETFPEVAQGTTNKYANWEVVDPEKWVPDGYVVIRVDSRGSGRSPGVVDVRSPRETRDFAACIDWAGVQPWSNGKVGLNGISYYAINQWHVAALKPKHLAALCVWEGAGDYYRDSNYHGGILSTFVTNWYDKQVESVQYGLGKNGPRSAVHGDLVCGPETFTRATLKKNRTDLPHELRTRKLDDAWYRGRSADWSKVDVPVLSAGNWGGQGLHPRGNIDGFVHAASKQKWLEMHGREHWTEFYTDYGLDLQKRFFGHFLKGKDTGWKKQPKVLLNVRHPDEVFVPRAEGEWPIKSTKWTKAYLDPASGALGARKLDRKRAITYAGLGDGLTFLTPAADTAMEVTGPLAAKLFVSSETKDADLFLVVRLFSPDLKEVTFKGALDPHTPIAQGWLRASHRKLDRKKSRKHQPYHSHDEKQPLKPGQVYELDVEVWPTSIVVPAGYRLGLTVRGRDYVYPGGSGGRLSNMKNEFTGV
ncbi:MAG: CocE/NonD family hydrolase, partial [Rhodospirillaceae bacterium]|nr:CocE/NonD family hydrolase [Rhodospirillaceae bacterium]